jgi:aryl-alcohol dehydrogenase-like predicted oxidoreductase
MHYRKLGKTGLQVSALGFGAGAIGGLFVRGDRDEQRRAVARALEAGITYFDTAPSYGDGRSEENLGRVLRDLDAWDRVVVGTKVRLRPPDLDDPQAAIARSIEGSLRRLGRETVDLVQLHNPIAGTDNAGASEVASGAMLDFDTVLGSVAEGLRREARKGSARHVGFTGLGDAAALHALVATAEFATAQTYFNILNPSAGFPGATGGGQDFAGLIDAAAASGMGVIAIRVMAAGAVSAAPARHANAGDPGVPLAGGAAYGRDLERARAIGSLAWDGEVEGPMELAVRFALAKPGVSTVLVGYSDFTQVEDAIRWTERGPLPEEIVQRLVARAQ